MSNRKSSKPEKMKGRGTRGNVVEGNVGDSESDELIDRKDGNRKQKDENDVWLSCKVKVSDSDKALKCKLCDLWHHISCENVTEAIYEFFLENDEDSIHWYCQKCNTVMGKVIKNVTKLSHRQDEMEKHFDELEKETNRKLEVKDLEKLRGTVTSLPRDTDVKEMIKLELDEVKVHDEIQLKLREEFTESSDNLRNCAEQLVKASVKG